jgi:hypothetical protein
MLHMGLLRKQKSSIHSRRELALRKKLEEAWDHLPPHESSLSSEMVKRMDPSNGMRSSLCRGKEVDSFVNEQSIKVSGPSNYHANSSCEVARHATGSKDDIFGDLPLLESSKAIYRTGGDELSIVIEESFIIDQTDPDAKLETVCLKLINDYDITAQTSIDDFVKIEGTPDQEPICISYKEAASSSIARVDCLPNCKSISMAKTHIDMHLKYSGIPSLSCYSDTRSKCGSNNPPLGCVDMNANCSHGINKHGTSSAAILRVVTTRTEPTNY